MIKTQLRKRYKDKRARLSDDEVDNLSMAIANRCLHLDIWDFNCYHLYLSIERHKEINTNYLINILQGKDKTVVIPKSDFSTLSLKHYLLDDNTKLTVNSYGIPEPVNGIVIDEAQIDVVFVPLLAFDEHGSRVGYGKGFYDRFLANCRPDCLKIGISFFNAEDDIEDITEDDVKLNYCVTPEKIYKFFE